MRRRILSRRWLLRLASSLAAVLCAPVAAALATPLERLSNAKPGDVVTLPAGEFRGPLVVPEGVTLVGGAGVRIVADGEAVRLRNGAALRDVALEGEPALRIETDARASVVRVSAIGGRAAIVVGTGATLRLEGVTATCRPTPQAKDGEEHPAAVVATGATLDLVDATLGAGCHRAITASGGTLTAAHSSLEGLGTGIRALDLVVSLTDVSIRVGDPESGTALYAARSRVTVKRLKVVGGAYGVLARAGRLVVDGLETRGTSNSAASIVNGLAELHDLRLTGPFSFAAVSASDAVLLELRDAVITSSGRTGVTVVRTPLVVERVRISGLRRDGDGDFGHGVMAVQSSVRATALVVDDADGAGVWVQRGDATLAGLDVRGAKAGWVQLGGTATLDALTADATVGVGLVAAGRSRVTLATGRLGASVGTSWCVGATLELAPAVVVSAVTPNVNCGDGDLNRGLQQLLRPPSAPPATR